MAKVKVKKVIDGDTFQDIQNRFFRLADVDAPDKKERGYQNAKETLSILISDEYLSVQVEGQSYGRKVVKARKLGEKTTINEKMRRRGYK